MLMVGHSQAQLAAQLPALLQQLPSRHHLQHQLAQEIDYSQLLLAALPSRALGPLCLLSQPLHLLE